MAAPVQDGMPAGLPRLLAVATITIGLSMSVLSNSMTNLALPYIAQDLNITAESSIWIVNAYQIAIVVALLPLASLGEIVGEGDPVAGAQLLAPRTDHFAQIDDVQRPAGGFGVKLHHLVAIPEVLQRPEREPHGGM